MNKKITYENKCSVHSFIENKFKIVECLLEILFCALCILIAVTFNYSAL